MARTFRDRFLCPGGDAGSVYAQLRQDLLQPCHPLAQRIQQGDLGFGTGDLYRHTGETGAAADVDYLLAREIGQGQQRQAVQQVQLCHLIRLGDGGEVHDLILLHHSFAKGAQALAAVFVKVQAQPGQTFCQCLQHHA